MFFTEASADHQLPKSIEEKMAKIALDACQSEGRPPLMLKEALQVVRYVRGEFYGLHRDNSELQKGTEERTWRPRRTATILVYLNTVCLGGETFFPLARAVLGTKASPSAWVKYGIEEKPFDHPSGVAIHPRQGQALLFWSTLPDGGDDLTAIHSAEPVWMGQKWIATRWCFELELPQE